MAHLNTMPGGVDLCVEVFCVYERRVLLRRHDKYGIWLGVGGHVEATEDAYEAAVREVQEEAGLELEPLARPDANWDDNGRHLPLPAHIHRHRISDSHEHVAFVYYARATTDVVVPGAGEVAVECRWLTIDEVLDPALDVQDSIRLYAYEALAQLGFGEPGLGPELNSKPRPASAPAA